MPYTAGTDPRKEDGSVRERIVATAYELFCHHGVNAVGVNRVVAEAGVAKMSLYRHFASKDDLVLAVVERREELWTRGWLEREVDGRGDSAADRLLAIFDAYGEWFDQWARNEDYEGCFFINSMLETHGPANPIGAACAVKMAVIQSFLEDLAEKAGVRDPECFAAQWYILMAGSIVAGMQRDPEAAKRARQVGSALLKQEQAAA